MKHIVILGSTGSIGASTLDVVSKFPEDFQVVGLAAGSKASVLADQIRTFRPGFASHVTNTDHFQQNTSNKLSKNIVPLCHLDFFLLLILNPKTQMVILAR